MADDKDIVTEVGRSTAQRTRWFGERIFNAPASADSALNRGASNACSPAPFSDSQPLAIHGVVTIVCPVVLLLLLGSPSAIVFAIAFAVIYAVYGVGACWGVAHIKEKLLKVIPFIAHQAKVSLRSLVVRVCASVLDVGPRGVFLGVNKPVLGVHSFGNFFMEASARLSVPIFQVASGYCFDGPARAYTLPFRPASRSVSGSAFNGQSAKNHAGHVDQIGHLLLSE